MDLRQLPEPQRARTLKELGDQLRQLRTLAHLSMDQLRSTGCEPTCRVRTSECQSLLAKATVSARENGGWRVREPQSAMRYLRCHVTICLQQAGFAREDIDQTLARFDQARERLQRVAGEKQTMPIPRQVPPPETINVVGREAHVEELNRLLPAAPGVTRTPAPLALLTGAAGVGKTTLARHWAHTAAEFFPDGQLYTNLGGFDLPERLVQPATVLDSFLRALAVDEEDIPADLEGKAARFRTEVFDRRLLVVLDNAASAEQVRPLLPHAPGCRTVVTTRTAMAIGGHIVPVKELTTPEARSLLSRLIGGDRADVAGEVISELARLCGNLPLALQIVGQRLAAHPGIPLTDAVAELTEDTLGSFASADATVDIRTVFSWSFRALSAEHTRLIQLMALHDGPDLALSAISVLADRPPTETQALLRELVDSSIVEQTPGRYFHFHDLIKEFVREIAGARITATQWRLAHQRLMHWYLLHGDACDRTFAPSRRRVPLPVADDTPRPAFAGPREAFVWCDRERANLLAVAEQAARDGADESLWPLAAVLGEYFYLRRYWSDLETTHSLALASATRESPFAEAWMRNNLGLANLELGHLDEAVAHCRRAITLTEQIGDGQGTSIAYNNLGLAHTALHQWQDATEAFTKARALTEQTGNTWALAHINRNLGRAYAGQQLWDEALRLLQTALEHHRTIGNEAVAGTTLRDLGGVHAAKQHWSEAAAHYEQALVVHREVGDHLGSGLTLADLGDAMLQLGAQEQAVRYWRQALVELKEHQHPRAEQVESDLRAHDPHSAVQA